MMQHVWVLMPSPRTFAEVRPPLLDQPVPDFSARTAHSIDIRNWSILREPETNVRDRDATLTPVHAPPRPNFARPHHCFTNPFRLKWPLQPACSTSPVR